MHRLGPWGSVMEDQVFIHELLTAVTVQVSKVAWMPPVPPPTRMPFCAWGA